MASGYFVTGYAHRCPVSNSSFNAQEAAVVMDLLNLFTVAGIRTIDIGIICLYRAQANLLNTLLDNSGHRVRFCTTPDGVQGEQADFVIITTTRTAQMPKLPPASETPNFSIQAHHGYLTLNRANVAFSRARLGNILVCDPHCFSDHPFVNTFLTDVLTQRSYQSLLSDASLQALHYFCNVPTPL